MIDPAEAEDVHVTGNFTFGLSVELTNEIGLIFDFEGEFDTAEKKENGVWIETATAEFAFKTSTIATRMRVDCERTQAIQLYNAANDGCGTAEQVISDHIESADVLDDGFNVQLSFEGGITDTDDFKDTVLDYSFENVWRSE